MISIQHEQQTDKGEFYYENKGVRIAKMTYYMESSVKMAIDHTWVDNSLGGQGVGKLLLENAIAFARQNKYKIVPLCPFVAALMNKNQEWHDLL